MKKRWKHLSQSAFVSYLTLALTRTLIVWGWDQNCANPPGDKACIILRQGYYHIYFRRYESNLFAFSFHMNDCHTYLAFIIPVWVFTRTLTVVLREKTNILLGCLFRVIFCCCFLKWIVACQQVETWGDMQLFWWKTVPWSQVTLWEVLVFWIRLKYGS